MAEEANDQLAKDIIGSEDSAEPKGKGPKILVPLVVGVVVVGVCSGAGYMLGSLLRSAPAQAEASTTAAEPTAAGPSSVESEYYEFPTFMATLNTPRRDRIMQVTIVLVMKKENQSVVTKMLEKKNREMTSKLTLYLNSRTMEDVSGDKNVNRILREIRNMINDFLWPDRPPMIEKVLVKNLALQ